jgi:ATP-dependent protease ClpP protease subunit
MKEFKNQNGMVGTIEESEISFYLQERSSTLARFFIDEDVKDGRYYRPVVQYLLNTNEGDIAEIYINSGGGSLEGCTQIIEAIRLSSADVYGIITGDCHSAASIIALNCHDVLVTDSAQMLVHSASYGSPRSKQSDIKNFVEFSTKQLDKLIASTYEGFLSESEIKDVQGGKELWFDADEIRARLEKRNEYFESKHNKELEDAAQRDLKKSSKPRKSKKVDTVVQGVVDFISE